MKTFNTARCNNNPHGQYELRCTCVCVCARFEMRGPRAMFPGVRLQTMIHIQLRFICRSESNENHYLNGIPHRTDCRRYHRIYSSTSIVSDFHFIFPQIDFNIHYSKWAQNENYSVSTANAFLFFWCHRCLSH